MLSQKWNCWKVMFIFSFEKYCQIVLPKVVPIYIHQMCIPSSLQILSIIKFLPICQFEVEKFCFNLFYLNCI